MKFTLVLNKLSSAIRTPSLLFEKRRSMKIEKASESRYPSMWMICLTEESLKVEVIWTDSEKSKEPDWNLRVQDGVMAQSGNYPPIYIYIHTHLHVFVILALGKQKQADLCDLLANQPSLANEL